MGVFDHFPYTNFHELNLMWILEALKEIQTTTDQFVAINSLKYADPIQWNITSQYEKNTIVIDPATGTAYISVQPVPTGVALTNEDYWTVVFDLGSFVVRAAKNFTNRWESQQTLTATFSSNAGDWLVWNDTLYKVLSNIVAGDQYVIDSNIQHFTMEELIGHLDDLTTNNKDSIVAALNEIVSHIGDIEDLDTADQSNIVAAINEVVGYIGSLDDLITTDQSNIVAAINEEVTKLNNLKIVNVLDFGAAGDGVTDDTQSIQNAIDSLPNGGGIVYMPAGIYNITDTITLGNGSDNSGVSTKNSVILRGVRGTASTGIPFYYGNGTIINVVDTITDAIKIDGVVLSCAVEDLTIRGRMNADNGVHVVNGLFTRIHNVNVYDTTSTGIWFDSLAARPAGSSGVINNIQCQVRDCVINNGFSSNAICLKISGYAAGGDTNQSLFENMWLLYSGDGGAGMSLGYCDSNTFINIMEYRQGVENGSYAMILDGSEVVDYPDANVFVSFSPSPDPYSIHNDSGHNIIYGLMLGDGGQAPYNAHLIAHDNDGVRFNNINVTKDIPRFELICKDYPESMCRVTKNAMDDGTDYGSFIQDRRTDGVNTQVTLTNHKVLINNIQAYDVDDPYGAGTATPLTLENGVTGSLSYSRSYKDHSIHLFGIITLPAAYTSGQTIATFPAGIFTARSWIGIPAVNNNTAKAISDFTISSTSGTLKCYNSSNNEIPIAINCTVNTL